MLICSTYREIESKLICMAAFMGNNTHTHTHNFALFLYLPWSWWKLNALRCNNFEIATNNEEKVSTVSEIVTVENLQHIFLSLSSSVSLSPFINNHLRIPFPLTLWTDFNVLCIKHFSHTHKRTVLQWAQPNSVIHIFCIQRAKYVWHEMNEATCSELWSMKDAILKVSKCHERPEKCRIISRQNDHKFWKKENIIPYPIEGFVLRQSLSCVFPLLRSISVIQPFCK